MQGIIWMLLMWFFLSISKVQEIYYNFRKIPYERTCEGFVVRKKPSQNGDK